MYALKSMAFSWWTHMQQLKIIPSATHATFNMYMQMYVPVWNMQPGCGGTRMCMIAFVARFLVSCWPIPHHMSAPLCGNTLAFAPYLPVTFLHSSPATDKHCSHKVMLAAMPCKAPRPLLFTVLLVSLRCFPTTQQPPCTCTSAFPPPP